MVILEPEVLLNCITLESVLYLVHIDVNEEDKILEALLSIFNKSKNDHKIESQPHLNG